MSKIDVVGQQGRGCTLIDDNGHFICITQPELNALYAALGEHVTGGVAVRRVLTQRIEELERKEELSNAISSISVPDIECRLSRLEKPRPFTVPMDDGLYNAYDNGDGSFTLTKRGPAT